MKFYPNIGQTFVDLKGYNSMILHSLVGCNLHCFGCHNYDNLVLKKHKSWYDENDIIEHIKLNGFLFDAIIFSGGEFLMETESDILNLLHKVRSVFDGIIIINTNGSYPDKVLSIIRDGLADGFHVDMKLPYHLCDIKSHKDIYKDVIGIIPTNKLLDDFLRTINIVISDNSKHSVIRTVKYPNLSNEFFYEIEKYVKERNDFYKSNIEWNLNEFVNL